MPPVPITPMRIGSPSPSATRGAALGMPPVPCAAPTPSAAQPPSALAPAKAAAEPRKARRLVEADGAELGRLGWLIVRGPTWDFGGGPRGGAARGGARILAPAGADPD